MDQEFNENDLIDILERIECPIKQHHECVVCGSKKTDVFMYDLYLGGFVCRSCILEMRDNQ